MNNKLPPFDECRQLTSRGLFGLAHQLTQFTEQNKQVDVSTTRDLFLVWSALLDRIEKLEIELIAVKKVAVPHDPA